VELIGVLRLRSGRQKEKASACALGEDSSGFYAEGA
jgi:hypothetical protein